jgi:hypothetical protein
MLNRTSRCTVARLPVLASGFFLSIAIAICATGQTGADYRSRMQSVNASTAFEASGQPDISLLPTGREWVTHIQHDLLPCWTMSAALGNPLGNFPTFRANDGSVIDPKTPWGKDRNCIAQPHGLATPRGRLRTSTKARPGCTVRVVVQANQTIVQRLCLLAL